MIYKIKARFKTETAADYYRKLTDGSIASQKPDGEELVAAMHRAVVGSSGEVEWCERCFCDPPLAHERATVLDHHFDDITTEEIDDYQQAEGQGFMGYLDQLAGETE